MYDRKFVCRILHFVWKLRIRHSFDLSQHTVPGFCIDVPRGHSMTFCVFHFELTATSATGHTGSTGL